MDPLAFTEDNSFGLEPYQQFERLENEYEALAAKKRKAQHLRPHSDTPNKRLRQEENPGVSIEEIMEVMNYGMRRKSRKLKKRGRRKGSKNKVSPEITRKLGDANLHYAHGRYEEAIRLLKEVIRLSPNLPDPYHTLGLIYDAMGDKKRALNFYMLAAHLVPKDASLWKLLVTWSIEEGNHGQARYCLCKAITADPEDISLRFHRASLYVELGDFQRAAESYEQISRLQPNNTEVLRTATELYKKCGQHERAVNLLEDNVKKHPNDAGLSVVHLLTTLHMEARSFTKALEHIEHVLQVHGDRREILLHLKVKAGICHLHLGHVEKAEAIFSILQTECASEHRHLIIEVADSLMSFKHYESALRYYMMIKEDGHKNNGYLHMKIAKCHLFLGERGQAIECFYKALAELEDSVDVRLTLSSLLLEESKDDEAISVLSPPANSESTSNSISHEAKPWWSNGEIKLKLSQIYKAKGSIESFVDVIFPVVRETLFLETVQQKVKSRKRLSRSVLSERIKVLDDLQTDTVFQGFRPVASASDL